MPPLSQRQDRVRGSVRAGLLHIEQRDIREMLRWCVMVPLRHPVLCSCENGIVTVIASRKLLFYTVVPIGGPSQPRQFRLPRPRRALTAIPPSVPRPKALATAIPATRPCVWSPPSRTIVLQAANRLTNATLVCPLSLLNQRAHSRLRLAYCARCKLGAYSANTRPMTTRHVVSS